MPLYKLFLLICFIIFPLSSAHAEISSDVQNIISSVLPSPKSILAQETNRPSISRKAGDIAYAFEYTSSDINFGKFPLPHIDSFTRVKTSVSFILAADFYPIGTVLYAVDFDSNLYQVDLTDGTETLINTMYGFSSVANIPTGLTIASDGTAYLSTLDFMDFNCKLYTLNLTTGAVSLINSIPGTGIIDIAIDSHNNLFALDQDSEELCSINPSTGAVTTVGSLGIALQNAQGMDFDSQDTLYAALCDGVETYFSTIDTSTGLATVLDTNPGEFTLAIPHTPIYAPAMSPVGIIVLGFLLFGGLVLVRRRNA